MNYHRLVFHYIFIPWLQHELDVYVVEANDTKPRYDRTKILPHGRPREIFEHPEEYNTQNFGVSNVICIRSSAVLI